MGGAYKTATVIEAEKSDLNSIFTHYTGATSSVNIN